MGGPAACCRAEHPAGAAGLGLRLWRSQRTEGEENPTAGVGLFWFRQTAICWATLPCEGIPCSRNAEVNMTPRYSTHLPGAANFSNHAPLPHLIPNTD